MDMKKNELGAGERPMWMFRETISSFAMGTRRRALWTMASGRSNRKPTNHVFPVQWLLPKSVNPEIISRVQRELDFYLVELREANPWAYAVYHCGTSANMYSKIHWSYFANGNCGERYASMVIEDPELGKGIFKPSR